MDKANTRSPVGQAQELIDKAWTLRWKALQSPPATEADLQQAVARFHGYLSEAVGLLRAAGATRELVGALGKLGHAEENARRVDAALACYEEAVAVARGADHRLPLAHALRQLGDLHRKAERLTSAEECYAEALALYDAQDEPPALDHANALRPMAILQEELGRIDEARTLWQRARELYGVASIEAGVAECTDHLTRLG
jgi:tetratricopeptide (TPR) repeat protein